MSEATPGQKLVIALGWCWDDFESEAKQADTYALRECLRILEQPDDGLTPAEINKSDAAKFLIVERLKTMVTDG